MRICVGSDAAKVKHWAVVIAIDTLMSDLRGFGEEVVIGLNVAGPFARFLKVVLLAEGFTLVHTPGIAVNRAGQGFAGGERKSDPRDVHTIGDLLQTRDLHPILADDDTLAALRLKVGRRRELVHDQTRRMAPRLRGLLCSIHPGLERALDLICKGSLALLARFVTPAEIRRAGKSCMIVHLSKTPHLHGVEVRADRALKARGKIARIDRNLEALLASHPDGALICSLPGMGAMLAAQFLACVGNKALKRAFYQSTFCAVSTQDPLSKAFHGQKRRQGKHHTQALIALARHRVTVIRTMLQRRKSFNPNRKAA